MFGFLKRLFSASSKVWKTVSATLGAIEGAEGAILGEKRGLAKKLLAIGMIRQVLKLTPEEWESIKDAVSALIDAAVTLYNALGVFKK